MKIKYIIYNILLLLPFWGCNGIEKELTITKNKEINEKENHTSFESTFVMANFIPESKVTFKKEKAKSDSIITKTKIIEERNTQRKVTDLVFIDETNNKIIKSINLKQNNPFYEMLNIDMEKAKSNPTFGFKVDNIPISSLLDSEDLEIYNRDIPENLIIEHSSIRERVFSNMENHVIIIYSATLRANQEKIGLKSKIEVYNKQGKLIHTLTEPLYMELITITENGQYMCYTYGAEDEWGIFLDYGYKIIDIINNKLIVDESSYRSNFREITISSHNDIIWISLFNPMKNNKNLVYDLVSNNIYELELNWNEFRNIQKIDDKGVIIKNESGDIVKFLYKEDFEIRNIK